MKVLAVMMTVLIASVVMAGCASSGSDEDDASIEGRVQEDFELDAGRGAISGLLVDDRFRPLHLTADPQTEFQAAGFILLQETGQEVRTNENGEFSFVNLEPGTYTLRITAEGYESVPESVAVESGVFNEVTPMIHRVTSEGSSIVTQEFSVFKACEATLIVIGSPVPCTLDMSGDTDRDRFVADYSEFENATYLVTEFLANQQGFYEIRVNNQQGCGGNYAIEEIVDGDYIKIINEIDVAREENHLTCGNEAWTNEGAFGTILYVDGIGKQETTEAGFPTFGAGVYFAVEGKFVQSVFVGEPEVDLDSYCVLC